MLTTGERTGNVDQVLDKVTEYYDSEAESTIEKSGVLLFVLLIMGAGVCVLIIAAGFYGGYFRGLFGSGGG
jgi:type II secretory pathway component PulF